MNIAQNASLIPFNPQNISIVYLVFKLNGCGSL